MKSEKSKTETVDLFFLNMNQFFLLQHEQEKTAQQLIGMQTRMFETVLSDTSHLSEPRSSSADHMIGSTSIAAEQKTALQTDITLSADPVKRHILKTRVAKLDKGTKNFILPPDKAILVIENSPPKFAVIERTLANLQNPIYHIVPGKLLLESAGNCIQVDFSSLQEIQKLREMIIRKTGGICAVFNMMALHSAVRGRRLTNPLLVSAGNAMEIEKDSANRAEEVCDDEELESAKKLFLFLKVFSNDLKSSALSGGAWLVNLSLMDGWFGLKKKQLSPLGQAGCIGLTKAIARELPQIRVKCVDVDPAVSTVYLITRLKQELLSFDDLVEVGLDGQNRWRLDVIETPASKKSGIPAGLDPESVVLVTGGAYGIVAEILKAMAHKYRCHLVLIGRSPLPGDESAATRQLPPSQLRRYLIAEGKSASPASTPAQILSLENKILKARQIRANLSAMQKSCASVEYHCLDICDTAQFGRLIDQIYEAYGRVDGVIHGAGVIDDKHVGRKSEEAFSRVFDTKVAPAMVLSRKLRPDNLKFLCFFSSVAARFGNRGQTDYCAANEILNKLANRLDAQWDARVFAINWGPWDAGMVNPDLRSALSKRGFSFIPVQEGAQFFLDELEECADTTSEILISRKLEL